MSFAIHEKAPFHSYLAGAVCGDDGTSCRPNRPDTHEKLGCLGDSA